MEKKCKKAKRQSEEALQIAVKRREVKSKGEKGRYKHLNVEIQMSMWASGKEPGRREKLMENKCKKAKWLSGEALQIAVKRREVKSKREKERYSI